MSNKKSCIGTNYFIILMICMMIFMQMYYFFWTPQLLTTETIIDTSSSITLISNLTQHIRQLQTQNLELKSQLTALQSKSLRTTPVQQQLPSSTKGPTPINSTKDNKRASEPTTLGSTPPHYNTGETVQ